MWGHSVQFWSSVTDWLLWTVAILGALTVISSFAMSVISGEVLKRVQADADQRIASAAARGEEAKADAARANEHAALLGAEAEQARLETERLRQQMAWRRLNKGQFKIIVDSLTGLDLNLSMSAIANDPESVSFANDIRRALIAAGFSPQFNTSIIGSRSPVVGIIISGPDQNMRRVAEAFTSAGFNVKGNERDGDVEILIGSKPPPQ